MPLRINNFVVPGYLICYLNFCITCVQSFLYVHVQIKYVETLQWIIVMVFNTTFNNIFAISCRSVLLVERSSSNNKTLNARLLARVLTGCHYT